jgi:dolichol-phosphate mannosyltransferase
LATIPIPLDSGDFCLMSRRVVKTLNQLPERHRFVRGLRSWVGFRQVGCPYARPARAGGRPKYTWPKLIRLALDGICTFSERPLRWATSLGLVVIGLSLVWACCELLWRPFAAEPLSGFVALAIGMLFLGGVQLLCIGILGEYLGRIHNEVKGRPLYIVDRLCGFSRSRLSASEVLIPGAYEAS